MQKKPYLQRLEALRSERSSWDSHAKEISEYFEPKSSRFVTNDRNRGDKVYNKIINNVASRSHRTLSAGMITSGSSPARPWFRLATPDGEMMENEAVRAWLHEVEQLMREVFSRSNFYLSLQSIYKELALYGTAAMVIVKDFDDVIRCYPMTFGEYFIAQNDRLVVDVFYREYDLTVAQVVKRFGIDNVSIAVRDMYQNGNTEHWVTCVHVIEPNDDRIPDAKGARGMPFRQVYFEKSGGEDKFLSIEGFEEFPVMVPRWNLTGNDVYGHSLAMEALGDVKQLQHQELRKAEGLDKMVRPPVKMPDSLKNREIQNVPGGVTYYSEVGSSGGPAPMYEVNLPLQHLSIDIAGIERRIEATFYVDLFLAISARTKNMTATEVNEIDQEKLLVLGPVLERVHNELLAPAINRTFAIMQRGGLLPPPPPELEDVDLKVEFISMLAQAQKLVSIGAIDRFLALTGSIAAMKPDVLDKVDLDQSVDEYAEILGVPPKLVVSDDKVEEMRANRAQQAAAANAIAAAPVVADVAKSMSETQTVGNNALARIMGNS